MEPTAPLLQEKPTGTIPRVYSSSDPEVRDLVTEVTPDGVVVSRWNLTAQERQMLASGCDLYVSQATFRSPLQPIMVTVGPPSLLDRGGSANPEKS